MNNNDINKLVEKIENDKEVIEQYKKIDEICELNSLKVINAFQECDLQEMHFQTSTGYGIDEVRKKQN